MGPSGPPDFRLFGRRIRSIGSVYRIHSPTIYTSNVQSIIVPIAGAAYQQRIDAFTMYVFMPSDLYSAHHPDRGCSTYPRADGGCSCSGNPRTG